MGNDASKGKKTSSQSNNKNNIPSSKSSDNDSSEWNRISPPSSPENLLANSSNANFITIEDLSKSTVLVENPKNSNMAKTESMNSPVVGLTSAFTAPSQGSNNRRRIIKATPPSPAGATPTAATTPVKEIPEEEEHPHKQHLPAVLSPKASTELLEESIEQSKNQRREKLSREQKSKRNQKLEERRKMGKSGSTDDLQQKKVTSQANPFSKFLKIFSVEAAFPQHKRPYEEGEVDREEAKEADKAAGKAKDGRISPLTSKRQKLDDSEHGENDDDDGGGKSTIAKLIESAPEWVPVAAGAAAMAAIAVMVALRINAATGGSNK